MEGGRSAEARAGLDEPGVHFLRREELQVADRGLDDHVRGRVQRIGAEEARVGRPEDAQLLLDICDNIEGKSFCPLGDAAAWPIQSAIKRFPEDFKKWLFNNTNGN